MTISVDGVVVANISTKRWIEGAAGNDWAHSALVIPNCGPGAHTIRVSNTVAGQIGMVWFMGAFEPRTDYLTNVYMGGALKLPDDAALTGTFAAGGNIQSAAGGYDGTDPNYSAASGAYTTVTDADSGTRYWSDSGGHVLVDLYNRHTQRLINEMRGYGFQMSYVDLEGYDPLMGNDTVHPAANPSKLIARLVAAKFKERWVL
jgi:hypothetical protein